MKTYLSRRVPIRFSFPAREARLDGWGHLVNLSSVEATLLTQFRLNAGDQMDLEFYLSSELTEKLSAEVISAYLDSDGYFLVLLRFIHPENCVHLGRFILDMLPAA